MSGQNRPSILSGLSLVAAGACENGKRLFLTCAGIKNANRLGDAELDLITACVTLTEMPGVDIIVKAAASGYLAWLMEYKLLAGTAGAPEVQAALLPLLKDERWDVRYATAAALKPHADNPLIRAALAEALAQIQTE